MILISGATGRVGSATCAALHEAGAGFRVLVRDADKFPFPASDKVEIVTGDLEHLLGRAPRSLDAFVTDHAAAFG